MEARDELPDVSPVTLAAGARSRAAVQGHGVPVAYGRCVTASRAEPKDEVPTVGMLRARRRQILTAAAAHGASNVRVFGSVARGTSTAASDVGLLVDFEAGRSLLDQARLRRDLQRLLDRSVDVVSARGLTDRDDDIRSDALPL